MVQCVETDKELFTNMSLSTHCVHRSSPAVEVLPMKLHVFSLAPTWLVHV